MAEPLATVLVVELRPEPTAPTIARELVAARCEAEGVDPDVCQAAALLVSELVTNAVIHARTRMTLEIHQAETRLRVSVTDEDGQSQVEIQQCEPTAAHGRGLQLVDMLALDWGVHRTGSSKTVWFELNSATG